MYFNYVQIGEDDKTPAMRLGLVAKPVGIEELLAHVPAAQLKAAA